MCLDWKASLKVWLQWADFTNHSLLLQFQNILPLKQKYIVTALGKPHRVQTPFPANVFLLPAPASIGELVAAVLSCLFVVTFKYIYYDGDKTVLFSHPGTLLRDVQVSLEVPAELRCIHKDQHLVYEPAPSLRWISEALLCSPACGKLGHATEPSGW